MVRVRRGDASLVDSVFVTSAIPAAAEQIRTTARIRLRFGELPLLVGLTSLSRRSYARMVLALTQSVTFFRCNGRAAALATPWKST